MPENLLDQSESEPSALFGPNPQYLSLTTFIKFFLKRPALKKFLVCSQKSFNVFLYFGRCTFWTLLYSERSAAIARGLTFKPKVKNKKNKLPFSQKKAFLMFQETEFPDLSWVI